MGGGTPLLEANRVGCDVVGFDINPMSYWIVKEEIGYLDLTAYDEAAESLIRMLEREIGDLHRTSCVSCGSGDALVKYFLWVKVILCRKCGKDVDLFPGYLLASDSRHPKNVFVCPFCHQLTETVDRHSPGTCAHCGRQLSVRGPASKKHCQCSYCKHDNLYPEGKQPPRHRLFAIEYTCPRCRSRHAGRFFKVPDADDFRRLKETEERWCGIRPRFVPDANIPSGDETNRLHRWGYKRYSEMFNSRQLLGLEHSARFIASLKDERVRDALATNLSDLLRYQNMLCRYDTMALKSLDIFSVHGFPVGLVQCESNFVGIKGGGNVGCVGSGGWRNILEKYRKAKLYCDFPFEIFHHGSQKQIRPIVGEWIGERHNGDQTIKPRLVELRCEDSAVASLPPNSLDAVFTDPPYFGNVQYAELIDFCYVWLRLLVGTRSAAFQKDSTRDAEELTVNEQMGRGIKHFTEGLSAVFQRMAGALKPGAPFAFTYHHNAIEAYYPVAVAVLDAGLKCSAALPCPAEMGASIHINGTGSSIVDTVFVCRTTGKIARNTIFSSPDGVAALVEKDLEDLRRGGVKPSKGDIRCIAFGHLVRLAIWQLHKKWPKEASTSSKLSTVANSIRALGGWPEVEKYIGG